MDLYEHQGKELFGEHGIPLVEGFVAETSGEARQIAERLGGKVAVKAQVQVGGRGKGGGIALVQSPDEAQDEADRILSDGFRGTPVTRVLVERLVDLAEQFYGAITLDRSSGKYLAMVSSKGGMDVEEIARTDPEAIRRSPIDPNLGLRGYQIRYLVGDLRSIDLRHMQPPHADVQQPRYPLTTPFRRSDHQWETQRPRQDGHIGDGLDRW